MLLIDSGRIPQGASALLLRIKDQASSIKHQAWKVRDAKPGLVTSSAYHLSKKERGLSGSVVKIGK